MKTMKIVTAVVIAGGISIPAWGADHATKDEAVAMVNKAAALYKKDGADKAFAAFEQKPGDFHDRDLYIMVYSTSGKVLAHGSNAKLIGKDMSGAQDVDGTYYVKDRMALAAKQKTFWQDYKFVNPVTKKIEPKEAYCDVEGDAIICSGVYK